MNKLKFYFFHLMPYGFVPRSSEFDSSWVTLSNEHYDPTRGHQLYNEYIDLLVAAEKYGYDGAIVNEHHANAYGTMPSPNLIAAMVVTRTQRMPVGIVGNAIPLHGNPVRVAEEIAMLDVISGGRIISGFVRGIGCEYFNNPVSPTDSVERFWEANELILKGLDRTRSVYLAGQALLHTQRQRLAAPHTETPPAGVAAGHGFPGNAA